MSNYVLADIKRICHKKSFLRTIGIYWVVLYNDVYIF